MRCEIPEFARCCFCFPLRFGLLVLAYIKLATIGMLLIFLSGFIISEIRRNGFFYRYDFPLFFIAIIFMIFFAMDFVFHIVLIISAHMKEQRKMRIFNREALFGLAIYVFGLIYIVVYLLTEYSLFGLVMGSILWILFFWLLFTQAYLIILVRSEVVKLERNANHYEFTNHTAEEAIKVDIN